MPSTVSTGKPILLGDLIRQDDLSVEFGDDHESIIPARLEARVALAVAQLWNVPVEDVSLKWGTIPDRDSLGDDTEFRLIGRGLDSWFAVVFECDDKPAFATRMRSGLYRDIAVAQRELHAGDIIQIEDVKLTSEVRWGPPRRMEPLVAGPGWRVQGSIQTGELIVEPLATPIPVVEKGDRVRLTWHRGMVTVSIEGFALHPAAVGQRVHVQLKGRRGESSGIVMGPGQAHLDS